MLNFFKSGVLAFLILSLNQAVANDTIHSFYYDYSDGFIKRFDSSLKSYAKTREVEIESVDAKDNPNLQLNQIYNTVSTKDPLLINLSDIRYAGETLFHVKNYHNRVIFFNRMPPDNILKSYSDAWFVGTNSNAAGKYQFDMIKDYIDLNKDVDRNHNGVLDIIILQGEKDNIDSEGRTEIILQKLEENKIKYNVISKNYDNWNFRTAGVDVKKQAEKVGLKNVDMIISNNDVMALGAIEYLNSVGYNLGGKSDKAQAFIPVFGVDGLPRAINAIRENKMSGTVFADFSALAKVVVDLATDDSKDEEYLTQKLWFKVSNRKVMIPFLKFANFKDYVKKTYPVSGSY